MGVTSLIRRALHPGTSLKQNLERITPVDALTALARTPATGSTLVHARQGWDNLWQLRMTVNAVTVEVFQARDWDIRVRPKYTMGDTLTMFIEQIWREYMGEPCVRCKGHGVIGRKLDMVRHHLAECATCHATGLVLVATTAYSVQSKRPMMMKRPCPSCHGKKLIEIKQELKAGRLRSCPECWGSGAVPASVRARARAIHYGNSQVHRVWQERFRVVLATLRTYEMDALILCREYLFGPENY